MAVVPLAAAVTSAADLSPSSDETLSLELALLGRQLMLGNRANIRP